MWSSRDLPGIYSLSPYTLEEVVSRNYLVTEKPDAILNIVDGTNIERNLYLTSQLIELGIPVVVAVNMMDLVRKNGDKIDLGRLGAAMGCKAVEMSALKGEGCKAAARRRRGRRPQRQARRSAQGLYRQRGKGHRDHRGPGAGQGGKPLCPLVRRQAV